MFNLLNGFLIEIGILQQDNLYNKQDIKYNYN